MNVTLESTNTIVMLDGSLVRLWRGKTSSGVSVSAFIARVAVEGPEQAARELEAELLATLPPEVWAPRGTVL